MQTLLTPTDLSSLLLRALRGRTPPVRVMYPSDQPGDPDRIILPVQILCNEDGLFPVVWRHAQRAAALWIPPPLRDCIQSAFLLKSDPSSATGLSFVDPDEAAQTEGHQDRLSEKTDCGLSRRGLTFLLLGLCMTAVESMERFTQEPGNDPQTLLTARLSFLPNDAEPVFRNHEQLLLSALHKGNIPDWTPLWEPQRQEQEQERDRDMLDTAPIHMDDTVVSRPDLSDEIDQVLRMLDAGRAI